MTLVEYATTIDTKKNSNKKDSDLIDNEASLHLVYFFFLKTSKDGNCFYRAIAINLYGDELCHTLVRLLWLNQLIIKRSMFEQWTQNNFNVESLVSWHIGKIKEELDWFELMINLSFSIVAFWYIWVNSNVDCGNTFWIL